MASPHQILATHAGHDAHVAARLWAEFDALPGLRLTLAQAARLCHSDPETCQHALEALVQQGWVRYTRGRYQRASS